MNALYLPFTVAGLQAGVKGIPITFLMTDNQIVKEKFLVYLNDLLSTGYIADLCTPEDKDNFSNSVRGELKQAGIMDTPENCWDYFINKVRKQPASSSDMAEPAAGSCWSVSHSSLSWASSR